MSSLICSDSRDWDVDIIKDLFNERDQFLILSRTLLDRVIEDRLYWSKEALVLFTVKSAYRMLWEQKGLWNTRNNSDV